MSCFCFLRGEGLSFGHGGNLIKWQGLGLCRHKQATIQKKDCKTSLQINKIIMDLE